MTAPVPAHRLARLLTSFASAAIKQSDASSHAIDVSRNRVLPSLFPASYSVLGMSHPNLPAATHSAPATTHGSLAQLHSSFNSSPLPALCFFALQTKSTPLGKSLPTASYGIRPSSLHTSFRSYSNITNQQHQQPHLKEAQETGDQQQQAPRQSQHNSNQEDSVWTAPNLLSVARGVSGPFIAALILQDAWSWAVGATAIAGASDWADGALARRLGQTSVLGSYLDPLADKILVCCVVGALAAQGAAPTWVAVLVIGRDAGLVVGMALHRWRSLGWRTSGITASQFFSTQAAGDGAALPFMQPFLISKANTVLQLALVSSCMTHAWVDFPSAVALHNLELMTAGTTVASLVAYAWAYATGKLLPIPKTP